MANQLRQHMHAMWDAVAPRWAEHADYVDSKAAALTKHMLDAAQIGPADAVLELACGTGGLGVAAAALARSVVVSDVAASMVALAADRLAVLGLANATARVLDLEEIAEPDASFDVVVCREGLMFALDPGAALREIHRVLRPGGRLVAAVWGPPADNPWLSLVFEALAEQLGRPMPPPGIPGPFSLCDAGALVALAAGAGFDGGAVEEIAVTTVASDFDEWWRRTSALAGPLAEVLPTLPDATLQAIVERLRADTATYTAVDGTLSLPGVSLLLTATTP